MTQLQRTPLKLGDDFSPLFPVQAFFNAIGDKDLPSVIAHLVRRRGYSSDYCHCQFPADLDPNEEPFEGVRFSLFDDSTVITEGQFAECLERVSESFGKPYPADADGVAELVASFYLPMHE